MMRRSRFLFLWMALGTSAAAAGAALSTLGPDAAGYTVTDEAAFNFVNVASSGIQVLAGTDDGTADAPIGFAFEFYGESYDHVCISSNGLLTLGGCADAFANQDLTATPTPGGLPVIAPFWTDLTFLRPDAGAVHYETVGETPARQFVVQWTSAFPQNAPRPVTVQAVLSEGSHDIRFQYQSVDAGAGVPASLGGTATVGICDAGGHESGRCLQWSHAAPVLNDGLALLIRAGAPETPPLISNLTVSPATVWPPNNQMVNVTVNYTATGAGPVSCALAVTSSIPPGGPRGPAWTIVNAHHVRVRATRPGNSNGLVYTVTVTCTSQSGMTASASTTVLVPHDRGRGQ